MNKNLILGSITGLLLCGLSSFLSYQQGFKNAGGNFQARTQAEVDLAQTQDHYQYIPAENSLEDSLKSGNYSYCIVYPGVGLAFDGVDFNGQLVVSQAPLTYPARKKGIIAGARISTPLEVIKGELGSPLKLSFSIDNGKPQSAIMARTLVKKCYRFKEAQDGNLRSPLKDL